MANAAELTIAEEMAALRENAELLGWTLEELDTTAFVLGFPASDGSTFWVKALCDGYPAQPPAWHWYNPETQALDHPRDTPRPIGFFHGKGVICAPWNRLAYKTIDPRGPHPELNRPGFPGGCLV